MNEQTGTLLLVLLGVVALGFLVYIAYRWFATRRQPPAGAPRYVGDADDEETRIGPGAPTMAGGQTAIIPATRPPDLPVESGPPRRGPWRIIPIFYGTDRRRCDHSAHGCRYDRHRNTGQLDVGIVEVSIPRDYHAIGKIERPSYWRLEFREDPSKHFVIHQTMPLSETDFVGRLRMTFSQSTSRDIMVFVHGYNMSFDGAAYRTAQLAYDLQFAGVSAMYSWPSSARASMYTHDEMRIEWSEPRLSQFLRLLSYHSGAHRIHVIAHSMGSRALTRALTEFASAPVHQPAAALRNIVLAAPDIDADTFRQLARRFYGVSDRVTLYASSKDKALLASHKVHGAPRAGDSGKDLIVMSGLDTIDGSSVDTSFLGHSYYGSSREIISDLFYLIHKGLAPQERHGIALRHLGELPYWEFHP